MSLEVALVFILALGFGFFVIMRQRTQAILYNFFAIGCLIPLGIEYSDQVAILIVVSGLVIWLIYDSFFKGV